MQAIMTTCGRVVVSLADNPPYSRRRRGQGGTSAVSSLVAARNRPVADDIPRPTSGRPSITIDLTYHAILLATLTTTLVLLALRRPRAASGQAAERQRVRSR
jgi:hypothetical protein